MSLGINKIVWAIDVSQENNRIWSISVKVIRELTKGTEIFLHPVYVLEPNQMKVPASFDQRIDLAQKEAETRLLSKLKKIGIFVLNLMKPKVISLPVYTIRGATKALHDYATEIEADLILVGTHGRTGVPRLSLGSFAESLFLQSTIPLIVIGESSRSIERFDHILFPSDFSEKSDLIFERVLSFAKHMKSRITIVHILKKASESEMNKFRYLAEHFAKMAEQRGILADILLRTTSIRSVSDTILRAAKELEVTFIAMAAQSGVISSTLVGSTTRQVVRRSHCPVWVIHEKRVIEAQKHLAA